MKKINKSMQNVIVTQCTLKINRKMVTILKRNTKLYFNKKKYKNTKIQKKIQKKNTKNI